MNPTEIRELIALAKTEGVKSLRVGDIEIHLHPAVPEGGAIDPRLFADQVTKDSPDEILNWSAGGSGFQDDKGRPILPPLTGETHAEG